MIFFTSFFKNATAVSVAGAFLEYSKNTLSLKSVAESEALETFFRLLIIAILVGTTTFQQSSEIYYCCTILCWNSCSILASNNCKYASEESPIGFMRTNILTGFMRSQNNNMRS